MVPPLRRNSHPDAAQISGTYGDDPNLDFRPHVLAESMALCNTYLPWQPANHSGMSVTGRSRCGAARHNIRLRRYGLENKGQRVKQNDRSGFFCAFGTLRDSELSKSGHLRSVKIRTYFSGLEACISRRRWPRYL